METTEKIVESYVRYVKKWATIPNIPCSGQHEIDLLAFDPITSKKYHIEISVSISNSFRKLTNKPFCLEDMKKRTKQASQRRTLGFFIQHKFGAVSVKETLNKYGFEQDNYEKIIVSWGWCDDVPKEANENGIDVLPLV